MEPDPKKHKGPPVELVEQFSVLDLKIDGNEELRKHIQVMIKKYSSLSGDAKQHKYRIYALKVWNKQARLRSKIDKVKMSAFTSHWNWSDHYGISHDVAPDKLPMHSGLDFYATIDAINLLDHPPPGYFDFFWGEFLTHSGGQEEAVLRMIKRNKLVLSDPNLLILMQHGFLHFYTDNMAEALFTNKNRGLTQEAWLRYRRDRSYVMDSWIAIIRLRSNALELNPAEGGVITIMAAEGTERKKWRADQRDMYQAFAKLYAVSSLNAVTMYFAEGGERVGYIWNHVSGDETPFLGIGWLFGANPERIYQWYEWSLNNGDEEEEEMSSSTTTTTTKNMRYY